MEATLYTNFCQFVAGRDRQNDTAPRLNKGVKLLILAGLCGLLAACGSKVVRYPQLNMSAPHGYVELFAATVHGLWLKNLEEGPVTWHRFGVTHDAVLKDKNFLCATDVPQWPGKGLGSLGNRPIADNFSVCRFPMPPGKHHLYINSLSESLATTGLAVDANTGQFRQVPVFVDVGPGKFSGTKEIDVEVKPGRVTVLRADVRSVGKDMKFHVHNANTTLPIPEKPDRFDPDPNSVNELIKLLDSNDWGFRWYAARRLGLIGDRRAETPLKSALNKEKHADVRNELRKALEKYQ